MWDKLLFLALSFSTLHLTFGSVLEDLLNIQDASPVPLGNSSDDIDGREFAELDKLVTLNSQQTWNGSITQKPYAVISNRKYVYNTQFNSAPRQDASSSVYKLIGQVMAIVTTERAGTDQNENISAIFSRLRGAVLVEYYRSQGAFVFDDEFDRWRFCTWVSASRIVNETGHLRICFPYELLNLGPFPRKPVRDKDVLERDTVKRLYRMAKSLEKAEPFLEEWLSDEVGRATARRHPLLTHIRHRVGMQSYWQTCSSQSSDGTLYVNLLAFGSSIYTQTCKLQPLNSSQLTSFQTLMISRFSI